MVQLIVYSLIGGVFSLIGGLVLLARVDWAKKIMTPLLAFAAGAFLGASLLDLLPEAIEAVADPHPIMVAALTGFLLFFVIERLIAKLTHRHERPHAHSDHTEALPFLIILGDSLHNFIDGIVIALAYVANPVLGLTTTLGVAAHEIPQEIADFSILLHQGWSRRRIILINILQSLLAVPGVILGYYASQFFTPYLPYLLGATAGVFLYIAASDLIPEIHHQTNHKHFFRVVIPMLTSLVLLAYLIQVAH